MRSLLQDRCEALILLGPQAPTSYLADLAARLPVLVVARSIRHRAIDVLHRAGLTVPGDISVIGYDDSRLARLSHVDLTTIAQDAEQTTTLAVSRAIDRLNGTPIDHRELVVPPRLVIRGTTAAARAIRD